VHRPPLCGSPNSLQRDPKGTKYLLTATLILMTNRIKKHDARGYRQGIGLIKSFFENTVLRHRAHTELMGKLKTGELTERPAYLSGEEGGKSCNYNTLVIRLVVHHWFIADNASFAIVRRLRLGKEDGAELETRVMAGYEHLMDGVLGLSCHPYYKIFSEGCRIFNGISSRWNFLMQERMPRMLAVMDLSDGDCASKSYGIPICADLSDDEKGNTRLGEVVIGVLVNMGSRLKNIIDNKTFFYEIIRKYVMIETVIVKRLEPQKHQQALGLLNEIFNAIRSLWWHDTRFVDESEKEEHFATIMFLVGLLQEQKPEGANGEGAAPLSWRNKLVVCWFVMNMMGGEEAKNPELMCTVGGIAMALIEGEVAGLPMQRMALGLLGRLMMFDAGVVGGGEGEFRRAVSANLGRKEFCDAVVSALAADHKDQGSKSQWRCAGASERSEASRERGEQFTHMMLAQQARS